MTTNPSVLSDPPGAPGVLGLDLSLTETGLALPDGARDVIMTNPKDGDRRLVQIRRRIADICDAYHIVLAVIEDLPTHAKGSGTTGMVHGVARAQLIESGVPYALVVAGTLKKYATGNGQATKPDMRVELLRRTGIDERNDNKVDAWFLRAMGLDHLGHPLVRLPARNRETLTVPKWPVENR